MRVLITRPESRAGKTAAKLTELGHDVERLPLFTPVHDRAAIEAALARPHSAIAVTSVEAVRGLAELGTGIAPHLGTRIFAIGKATAHAARAAGFSTVDASAGGGAELASLVMTHYASAGRPTQPILYLAGEKRMGRFEKLLAENGIDHVTVETYRMEPIPYSLEEQQAMLVDRKADAVFFFSREAANAFFALDVFHQSHEAIRKTLFLCLSRNIAEAVPEELRNSAVVSNNPNEEELIDLL